MRLCPKLTLFSRAAVHIQQAKNQPHHRMDFIITYSILYSNALIAIKMNEADSYLLFLVLFNLFSV